MLNLGGPLSFVMRRALKRPHRPQTASRWLQFVCLWALIGVVWLGVLPTIAGRPRVRSRLAELSAQGIDPSAMFYSELPAMDGILLRLDRLHRQHPEALWRPDGRKATPDD